MTNKSIPKELTTTLLGQNFLKLEEKSSTLEQYKQLAESYVKTDQSLAVLSDYNNNCSYIFSGSFGSLFGITSKKVVIDSAFEDQIFEKIHPDDLLKRHALELSYFQFQKKTPQEERHKYSTFSYIRVCNMQEKYIYITHRTFYVASSSNDCIWLSLCLYAPSPEQPRGNIEGRILNNENGESLNYEYKQYLDTILSVRELEVLKQISVGKKSKQIADELNISPYTVYRHRQNIIEKLKVTNSSQAVQVAILIGLITI